MHQGAMRRATLTAVKVVLVSAGALLSSCGTLGVVEPERDRRMMAQLAAGDLVLDCTILCSAAYIFNQDEIWMRHAARDWHGVAIAVMRSRWRQDIAYFLLGNAAEGLGHPGAADRYYRVAGALATGKSDADKCRSVQALCRGYSLPRDIYPRLKVVERALADERSRALPVARDDGWIDPPPESPPPK